MNVSWNDAQAMIEWLNKTAAAPGQVYSLPGGHSPFVTRPAELATVLTTIALTPAVR